MKPYFIYKGINSRDMGLSILKLPARIKPNKRGELITIPGRDGFLFENENAYNGKTLEVECTFMPPSGLNNEQIQALIMQIIVWLDGSGNLIFSDYSNYYYEATIINAIPIERLFKRYRRFIIAFEVQPFSKSITQTSNMITKTGKSVISISSFYNVKPLLTITGKGNLNISVNNEIINLKDITNSIVVDCELLNAVDTNGNNMNNHMVGNFPNLKPGNNDIEIIVPSGSTFTSMKIEYRSLWL